MLLLLDPVSRDRSFTRMGAANTYGFLLTATSGILIPSHCTHQSQNKIPTGIRLTSLHVMEKLGFPSLFPRGVTQKTPECLESLLVEVLGLPILSVGVDRETARAGGEGLPIHVIGCKLPTPLFSQGGKKT